MPELFFTRLEYRHDTSNQPYFERGAFAGSYRRQPAILIGMVALLRVKR
jgi:hypothetical protein